MNLPTRHMLLGMTLGAICATALAAIGPGFVLEAFADEAPAGFDTSKLVKFDGREYRIDYEDWVSTDPLSSSVVKKIEYGRVSYVTIATTATGTYSSDALLSPHVQYPGIDVTEVTPNRHGTWFAYWSGDRWSSLSVHDGDSYISLNRDGLRFGNGSGDLCIFSKGLTVC